MASKCAEMCDIHSQLPMRVHLALILPIFPTKTTYPYQVGNKDIMDQENEGPGRFLALLDTLLTTPNIDWMRGKHYRVSRFIRNFDLGNDFHIEGDTQYCSGGKLSTQSSRPGTDKDFLSLFC